MKRYKVEGKISEVFASICGEGLNVGAMQLFIRLAGCSESCRHCEGKGADRSEDFFLLRPWPGPRIVKIPNPITPRKLLQKLEHNFPLECFHCVAIIGGEPCCQSEFISEFASILNDLEIFTFADSMIPEKKAFLELYPHIDQWSLTLSQPGRQANALRNHKKMQSVIENTSPQNCYFRVIINSDDDCNEYLNFFQALPLEEYTLVIQPATSIPARINDWDTGTILEWVKIFQPFFAHIRWLPQVHKLLRIP